jgi:4-oxalocrotonate tautomerase
MGPCGKRGPDNKKWRRTMPIITIKLFEGRSLDEKRVLVKAVTDAVATSLKIGPERVRITLEEMDKRNHSVGGELAVDWTEPK